MKTKVKPFKGYALVAPNGYIIYSVMAKYRRDIPEQACQWSGCAWQRLLNSGYWIAKIVTTEAPDANPRARLG